MNRFFIRWAPRFKLIDVPNHRSSHHIPTPRGAGIHFSLPWLVLLPILSFSNHLPNHFTDTLIPGSLALVFIGFWDDVHHLSYKIKLLVHILVSMGTVYGFYRQYHTDFLSFDPLKWGGFLGAYPLEAFFHGIPLGLVYPILALILIWSINVYNFMDGTDGQASGQGIFILLNASVLAYQHQAPDFASLLLILACLLFGFFMWNKPPAKIFMGDNGSCFLGFIVPVLALLGFLEYKIPISVWFIAYTPFWFDATFTVLHRLSQGQSVTQPHQGFLFQKIPKKQALRHLLLVDLILLGIIYAPGFNNLSRIILGLFAVVILISLRLHNKNKR
ncbi:MAG: MraY family glycosyltransferase [Gammaproteobacteria bacterium]